MSSCLDHSVSKTRFRNNREIHDEKQLSRQRSVTVFSEEMSQSLERELFRSNRNHDLHATAVSILKLAALSKRKSNKNLNSVALKRNAYLK